MMPSDRKVSKPLAVACVILSGLVGWMLSGSARQRACSYDCPAEAPINQR